MMDFEWSKAEKILARKIYDAAVKGELAEIMRACKAQAARIAQPEQMWELEAALHAARRDFNDKYDFRYSRLTTLFALLLREARIADADLEGLSPDKRELIRRFARD